MAFDIEFFKKAMNNDGINKLSIKSA